MKSSLASHAYAYAPVRRTWAVPSQYNLTLDVMMDVPPAYVSGQVITRLEMTPEGRLQKCIVMHADDMEIFSTEASLDGGNTWLPLVYARNPGLQQLTVQLFKGTFNASSVLVRVGFGYPMSSWLDGFYRVRLRQDERAFLKSRPTPVAFPSFVTHAHLILKPFTFSFSFSCLSSPDRLHDCGRLR